MNLRELITTDYKALKPTDSIAAARAYFARSCRTHLPVAEGEAFSGCLAGEKLTDASGEKVIDCREDWERERYLPLDKPPLEALQTMTQLGGNLLPLLDEKAHYQDCVSLEDLTHYLTNWPFFAEPGAVLTLETEAKNYSISAISQIVESQNAKVLGCFLSNCQLDQVEITLKIDRRPLNPIADNFARFGYQIKEKSYRDKRDEVLRTHYASLMKYLDM